MAVGPLVAGNWKMNGLRADLKEVETIRDAAGAGRFGRASALLCLPATLVAEAARRCSGSRLAIGGEDCHAAACGAFTGDIAASMLADAGASFVIVGHSERRQYHLETDAVVKAKAEAALTAGLSVIVCVGESRAERDAGHAGRIVETQIEGSLPESAPPERLVVAYEPVWAIGTGLTPTIDDIAAMHAQIHARLTIGLGDAPAGSVRILYGGSVKPANAREILGLPHVDGALIGGASLKAVDFLGIAAAYV